MGAMSIINNLSSNHYQQILDITNGADTLYIISPFLMESFDTVFCELLEKGIKHIHMVTTLKNNDLDLMRKTNSLHSFCSLCSENNIKFDVYIDNKLHGKIYVASKGGKFTSGILTSANFTDSGLNRKHEWGVLINDETTLQTLINEVFSVCSEPLSIDDIPKIIKKIDDYFKNKQEPEMPTLDLTLDEFIHYGNDTIEDINADSDIRYFIKPVGSSNSPFPESHKLDKNIETLHFAKRKPRAVRIGDVLICYAVGTTKLLGYFEVITEPSLTGTDDDRWPWSVQAKNLCPNYSENWINWGNALISVRDKYPANKAVTYNGGTTLGALNYGSDKIRLAVPFAKHLIKTIEGSVNKEDSVSKPLMAYDMSRLDSLVVEIAAVLAQCCIDSETPIITYGDLAKRLSPDISPRNLDQPLGRLSDFCKEVGLPLLSVIVVNSDSYFPGSGFFKYFFPHAKQHEWEKIYIEQLNHVASYRQWDKLLDSTRLN